VTKFIFGVVVGLALCGFDTNRLPRSVQLKMAVFTNEAAIKLTEYSNRLYDGEK